MMSYDLGTVADGIILAVQVDALALRFTAVDMDLCHRESMCTSGLSDREGHRSCSERTAAVIICLPV